MDRDQKFTLVVCLIFFLIGAVVRHYFFGDMMEKNNEQQQLLEAQAEIQDLRKLLGRGSTSNTGLESRSHLMSTLEITEAQVSGMSEPLRRLLDLQEQAEQLRALKEVMGNFVIWANSGQPLHQSAKPIGQEVLGQLKTFSTYLEQELEEK